MSAYEPYPTDAASTDAKAPQPLEDDERLASRWRRFWAIVLDGIFIAIPVFVIAIVVAVSTGDSDADGTATAITIYAVYALAVLLYYPLTLSRRGAHNGQTFGKQLMKVRVVTSEGVPVTFWRGALRDVLGTTVLSVMTSGIYSLIDYPFGLFDKRRQCLHDKIAKTYVYRADASREPQALTDWPQPAQAQWPPPAAPSPTERWQAWPEPDAPTPAPAPAPTVPQEQPPRTPAPAGEAPQQSWAPPSAPERPAAPEKPKPPAPDNDDAYRAFGA
ncbi:RDD family protein [Conexibacter sp. CPCC 206217]|uniref:RDD family protein n=1 Tax=Conexibacter sp. CPCC 206217 TaxID=3064574 RepID=UPI002719C035|nr:RDD family protein [Conexibacter sp. CPCC 206217]MDO8212888.1 RDD family protein [Conexibacter sp. CPCC 206217]